MRVLRIGTKLLDLELTNIPNDPEANLRALQKLVGGYIEPCAPLQLKQMGIELLANEEGLIAGLDGNENLYPFFFVGQLVAVGVDYQAEDFVSLNDIQMEFLYDWLVKLDV